MTLTSRGAAEALLTWDEVALASSPEALLGYAVTTSCAGTSKDHNVTAPWLELRELSPGCVLTARVAVVTAAGKGPFSAPAVLRLAASDTEHLDSTIGRSSESDRFTGESKYFWFFYLLVSALLLVIVGLIMYMKGFNRCEKSSSCRNPHSKYQEHPSMCPSPCHSKMYGERVKVSQGFESPQMQPNSCLLRPYHYINDYAEPNMFLSSHVSQLDAEAYSTSSVFTPPLPRKYELPGFLPPPPPSYSPPLISHQNGDDVTCKNINSSLGNESSSCNESRSSSRSRDHSLSCVENPKFQIEERYRKPSLIDLSDYVRPLGCGVSDDESDLCEGSESCEKASVGEMTVTPHVSDGYSCALAEKMELGFPDSRMRDSFHMESPSMVVASQKPIDDIVVSQNSREKMFPAFSAIEASRQSVAIKITDKL